MKTIHIPITLYELEELGEEIRAQLIYQHIEFLNGMQVEIEDGTMQKEYLEHSEAEAISDMDANGYLFYSDGTMADTITYTGGHPKAGTTELTLMGTIIII